MKSNVSANTKNSRRLNAIMDGKAPVIVSRWAPLIIIIISSSSSSSWVRIYWRTTADFSQHGDFSREFERTRNMMRKVQNKAVFLKIEDTIRRAIIAVATRLETFVSQESRAVKGNLLYSLSVAADDNAMNRRAVWRVWLCCWAKAKARAAEGGITTQRTCEGDECSSNSSSSSDSTIIDG